MKQAPWFWRKRLAIYGKTYGRGANCNEVKGSLLRERGKVFLRAR